MAQMPAAPADTAAARPGRIHHATVKKAAAAGFAIFERDGMFHLQATDDEAAEMQGDWETATAAADAAARHAAAEASDEPNGDDLLEAVEADEPEEAEDDAPDAEGDDEEDTRSKSGVMPLDYHKLYTANGGGCGDVLDQTLRDTFMGDEGLKVAEFRAFVEAHGLWRQNWNGLNPGMIRMNAANVIRAKLRNDPEFVLTIPGIEGASRFGVEHKPRKVRASKAKTKAAEADMAAAIAQAEPEAPAA